jgi:predicted nucleic acid-binding protein
MILADTSVWVDHLSRGNGGLGALLDEGSILMHPYVVGELACGDIRNRREVLALLTTLPPAAGASDDEALAMIETRKLMGRGLGWVDVHLRASVVLSGCRIWSRDKQLAAAAATLKVRFDG